MLLLASLWGLRSCVWARRNKLSAPPSGKQARGLAGPDPEPPRAQGGSNPLLDPGIAGGGQLLGAWLDRCSASCASDPATLLSALRENLLPRARDAIASICRKGIEVRPPARRLHSEADVSSWGALE